MSHSIEDLSAGGNDLLFPRSIGPDELGDSLALMVWESFSDFISDGDAEALLDELGMESKDGIPDERIAEEMLIYLMWAHTRGVQLAFLGRSPEELVRKSLDSMHRAVFEDMVKNGTPREQIPIFEQRVSARYSDYYGAAQVSDDELGKTAFRNITGLSTVGTAHRIRSCAERAVLVANPLKDFLEDIQLED
jgi:hypothetical protein